MFFDSRIIFVSNFWKLFFETPKIELPEQTIAPKKDERTLPAIIRWYEPCKEKLENKPKSKL